MYYQSAVLNYAVGLTSGLLVGTLLSGLGLSLWQAKHPGKVGDFVEWVLFTGGLTTCSIACANLAQYLQVEKLAVVGPAIADFVLGLLNNSERQPNSVIVSVVVLVYSAALFIFLRKRFATGLNLVTLSITLLTWAAVYTTLASLLSGVS